MKELFNLLGQKVRDKITGTSGVVDSLTFDISGRVRAAVNPEYDKNEAKLPNGIWVDAIRLELIGKDRVMPVPDFETLLAATKRAA
jgi:hypothetical protein